MNNNTKICKHCKEQIAKGAKRCPKCGGKLGMPKWIIAIIVIVIIGVIAGAGSSGSSSTESGSVEKVEKFTLLEHNVSDESNDFAMYIEGKVQNNKDKDYDYAQITFTTYDAEGNTIGTCMDNINNLKANGTWKFKAICTESVSQIDHYELGEITGW